MNILLFIFKFNKCDLSFLNMHLFTLFFNSFLSLTQFTVNNRWDSVCGKTWICIVCNATLTQRWWVIVSVDGKSVLSCYVNVMIAVRLDDCGSGVLCSENIIVCHPIINGQYFSLTARSCQCDSHWLLKWIHLPDSPHSFWNQSYLTRSRKAPGSSVLCDEISQRIESRTSSVVLSDHVIYFFDAHHSQCSAGLLIFAL